MVGIYAELKHPSFFKAIGFRMEDMLLDALRSGGYAVVGENAFNNLHNVVPLVIQCFEPSSLKYLSSRCSLPLVQLIHAAAVSSAIFVDIAKYASGTGPIKDIFSPVTPAAYAFARSLVDQAHALRLAVHPYTFRADSGILPPFNGNFEDEETYFYLCLGMDGLFSEFPDRSRQTINAVFAGNTSTSRSLFSDFCDQFLEKK
jgi:glycerophosphoryl diester phosphodiesterase